MFVKVVSFGLFVASLLALFGPFFPLQHDKNNCLMTYMHPSFKQYAVNSSLSSRYRLFLYKEDMTVPREANVPRESGIPVLFIHGNGGSFKQVRSFGSEAFRSFYGASEFDRNLMANNMGGSALGELMGLGDLEQNAVNAFDFWSVDFREELSGLSGTLVDRQTEFVMSAVQTILHLYEKTFLSRVVRAKHIVLLGHSMGGVVALSAAAHPSMKAVASVVCMATPLTPVLVADSTMARVYRDLATAGSEGRLDNVSLTVVGGGQRDWFVPSRLSVLPAWMPSSAFYLDSLSIHKAHVDADHQCIVWCNQIVRAVIGGLFQGLDPQSRMLRTLPALRTKGMARRLTGSEAAHLGLPPSQKNEPVVFSGPAAVEADKEMKARFEVASFAMSDERNEVSAVKKDVCVVYDWGKQSVFWPVTISLSRAAVRLWVRTPGGKVADASHLMVPTQAYHLDDPRSGVVISVDHLLVRGIARLTFGNFTQLMICPNKTTFRLDHHHVCVEDGTSDCSQRVRVADTSTFVKVNYRSIGRATEGAVVYAVNHRDNQTRIFHSVESGSSVVVRFESSLMPASVEILVLFPGNSTNRSVVTESDKLGMFRDLLRPVVPDVLLAALCATCVFMVLPLSWLQLAQIAAGCTFWTGVLFVFGVLSTVLDRAFVFVAALCVSVLLQLVGRMVFAVFGACTGMPWPMFFVLAFAIAGACHWFASVLFVVPLLVFLVPLVSRDHRLVTLLLFSVIGDAPTLVAFVHTAIQSGRQIALSDVENSQFLLAYVVVLILLSPSKLFPGRFSPLMLAVAPLILIVAPLNSVYLVRTVALFAYLIVAQKREPSKAKID